MQGMQNMYEHACLLTINPHMGVCVCVSLCLCVSVPMVTCVCVWVSSTGWEYGVTIPTDDKPRSWAPVEKMYHVHRRKRMVRPRKRAEPPAGGAAEVRTRKQPIFSHHHPTLIPFLQTQMNMLITHNEEYQIM
jgi:hypothetical protein